MGGGTIPTPSYQRPRPKISIGRADEKLIYLLETERTVKTSGVELSAEEWATVLDSLVSETEETGALPFRFPVALHNTQKDRTQSELQN